jgi:hypothetical protein
MLELDQSVAAAFSPEDMLMAGAPKIEDTKSAAAHPASVEPDAVPETEKPAPRQKPKPPVDVTEEDRDAFMRHVLGSGRFTKTYTTAKGSIRIKIQTRTTAENDIVHEYVVAEARAGRVSSSPIATDYVAAIYRAYLCYSLHSIQIGDSTFKLSPQACTIQERNEWIRSNFSEIQLRFMLRALEDFETLMAVLYTEAVSSDFTVGRAGVF